MVHINCDRLYAALTCDNCGVVWKPLKLAGDEPIVPLHISGLLRDDAEKSGWTTGWVAGPGRDFCTKCNVPARQKKTA